MLEVSPIRVAVLAAKQPWQNAAWFQHGYPNLRLLRPFALPMSAVSANYPQFLITTKQQVRVATHVS
jgi:hypothetical protein